MSKVMELSGDRFYEVVEKETAPVLVDFWAPWCGHCTQLAPVFEEVAQELSGEIKCVKVNVDDDASLAERYGIMMLPTILVTVNGKEQDRLLGNVDKQQIISKVKKYH